MLLKSALEAARARLAELAFRRNPGECAAVAQLRTVAADIMDAVLRAIAGQAGAATKRSDQAR
jgi:hypothetical protein